MTDPDQTNGKTPPPVPGDVVWIDFDPSAGHEQRGLRPALVISNADYNATSSFLIVCPITRNTRPWAWKVELPTIGTFRGVILVDQVKSIDRRERVRRIAGRVPPYVVDQTRRLLARLVDLDPGA